MELLKGKLDLLPTATDEFLRYDSPVQMVRRIASEDMEVGGVKIEAGKHVVALVGAANRDPEEFENPDKLDITRKDNKHIAFGHGIHHCLGWSPAETEGQIAIGALLRTFPNLKLKTGQLEMRQPFSLRGVKQLPVTY
jgi:cytochrome P450